MTPEEILLNDLAAMDSESISRERSLEMAFLSGNYDEMNRLVNEWVDREIQGVTNEVTGP